MPSYHLVSDSGDQSFELPPGKRLVVGRGLSSDIALYDPTISRRHAELTARTDGVQMQGSRQLKRDLRQRRKGHIGTDSGRGHRHIRPVDVHLKAPPPPIAAEAGPPAGMIVRQVSVTGGASAGVTSRDAPGWSGQLRVDAGSADARQAKKLSMLLDVSQKLSGEFNLDRLLAPSSR